MPKLKFLIVFFVILLSLSLLIAQEANKTSGDIALGDVKLTYDKIILSKEKGLTKIELDDKSSLKIEVNGKTIEYPGFGKVSVTVDGKPENVDSSLVFDNEGRLIEASLTSLESKIYRFGNYEIYLPIGAGFLLKNGKVNIVLPNGEQIVAPKLVDGEKSDINSFSYYPYPEGSELLLGNGETFKGILNYNAEKNIFSFNKESSVDGFTVQPKGETYIDYNGKVNKDVNGAYISLNPEKGILIIGKNGNGDSPIINFNPSIRSYSSYGIYLDSTDHFSLKLTGDDSYIMIQNRIIARTDPDGKVIVDKASLIPSGEVVGEIAINEDEKGIYVKDNKVYLKTNGRAFDDLGESIGDKEMELTPGVSFFKPEKTTTAPIDLGFSSLNEKGELLSITGKNKLVIGNYLDVGYGEDPNFIASDVAYIGTTLGDKDPRFKEKTELKIGVSNRVVYNYPNKETFQEYTGIKVSLDSYSKSILNVEDYKMLMDLYDSLPPEVTKTIKEINIGNRLRGQAFESSSKINTDPSKLLLNLRHETFHMLDYTLRDKKSDFRQEWVEARGYFTPKDQFSTFAPAKNGFMYGYGASTYGDTDYEDVATFGDFIDNPEYFKPLLSDENTWNPIYRGKVALLYKYNFITEKQFTKIFSTAGLGTTAEDVDKYIETSKEFANPGKRK